MKRYARPAAYLILAIVTIYGVWQFVAGDPSEVMSYWKGIVALVPLIILLACLDVALEGVGWLWVYSRLGIRSWDRGGVMSFLAGRAGMLLPAQLGRLIRPDSMARLGRAPMGDCLRAEAAAFVLDATSVVALLAALAAAMVISPWAAPLAALAVMLAIMFLGHRSRPIESFCRRLARRIPRFGRPLSRVKLTVPPEFWWSWKTIGIICVEMAGWATHGAAMYLVIRNLPGSATLGDTIFFAAGSSVVGAGTGLPGGIGATEGLLGMSLTVMNVPAAHLALAIAAFRVLTFWIWIPIGWFALVAIRGRTVEAPQPVAEPQAVS